MLSGALFSGNDWPRFQTFLAPVFDCLQYVAEVYATSASNQKPEPGKAWKWGYWLDYVYECKQKQTKTDKQTNKQTNKQTLLFSLYHIAENFWGRKLPWIGEKYDFRGENFCRLLAFAAPKNAMPQILQRKLLQIATKLQNSWKFLPSKVSC